jgi:hypothetical protein
MRRYLTVTATLLVLAGCGDGSPTGTRFGLTLHAARARWESTGVDSYQITVRRLCFCGFVEPVRVTVEDGVVVSRTGVGTGDPVPAIYAEYFPDVPGLFAIVEEAAQDADDLDTEFDATYGFPAVISIDWAYNWADDEIVYRTEAFAATP